MQTAAVPGKVSNARLRTLLSPIVANSTGMILRSWGSLVRSVHDFVPSFNSDDFLIIFAEATDSYVVSNTSIVRFHNLKSDSPMNIAPFDVELNHISTSLITFAC